MGGKEEREGGRKDGRKGGRDDGTEGGKGGWEGVFANFLISLKHSYISCHRNKKANGIRTSVS